MITLRHFFSRSAMRIVVVAGTSFQISCVSSVLKSPVEGARLDGLRYGVSVAQVIKHTGHDGKPLFRFSHAGKDYVVQGYRPSNCAYSYVFVYEDKKLFSVMNTVYAQSVWEKTFGKYGSSLPASNQFGGLVASIKDAGIDLEKYPLYDKSVCGKLEHKGGENLNSSGLLGSAVIYAWVPGLREALLGGGLLLLSVEELQEHERRNSLVMQMEMDSSYQAFVKKLDALTWADSQARVMDVAGRPSKTINTDSSELFVYAMQYNVIIGFERNRMTWVGYDYLPRPPVKNKSGVSP